MVQFFRIWPLSPQSSPKPASPSQRPSVSLVEGKMSIPPCYYNWIYQVLTRLPTLLINLSILCLNDLPTLHPTFIRLVSCFKAIQTVILTDLEHQSFSEVIQVVNRLPQLKVIYIEDSKWDRPARFFPSRRLRVEAFYCTIDDKHLNTDVLDWLGSLQDLSTLDHLRIDYLQSSDWNKAYHILQRCMHSLRFVNLFPSDEDFIGSLSLSGHSKLECLDISFPSLHLPSYSALFASRISQLLSPSLVYLVISPFENLDLESLTTSQSSWKDIDDALDHPKFNQLAYFVMSLSDSYEGNIDCETLRLTFQKILPQSYRRGILWAGKYFDAIGERRGEHFPEQNADFFLFRSGAAFHICKDDEREFSITQLTRSYYRM
ncbi:hypothetical protein NLI96_g4 [Meripilus lineatus]|uniref:Uncharacterized protein n=1 Tax=Meripilus lineatus TaxID=2056292 RepID=A0AAD5YPA2_9APHY|nr:hypothetical protein NLI96_g4 [Physisporinus lineatus]